MVFKRELEKQIAKLKQENAELKEQNSHLYNDLTMTEAENVELEQQIKKYIEGNEKLEKENAELDMKRKAERQIFQGIVEKKNEQLTKAKEIIKDLISICREPYLNKEMVKNLEQAEQFLNSEDIILEDAQAGNSPFDADEVFNKELKAYPDEKVK